MTVTHREFVRLTAPGVAVDLLAGAPGRLEAVTPGPRLKAIAFDAFPVFSPASVASRADDLFPGRGASLSEECPMTISARKPAALRAILADGWALLPLRLVVGFGFAAHGHAKLARGPESFAAIVLSSPPSIPKVDVLTAKLPRQIR